MSVLRLPPALFESLRAHGEQSYPQECCGALLGRPEPEGWRIVALAPSANAASGSEHNRYQIAPAELVKIARRAREQGLELAGFYHSHPDHPAQWSQADLSEAHWLGCVYVITEVAAGRAAATSAFLLAGTTEEDKRFEPQEIALEARSPIH
jgi:proteasome lid subunit RPN8/RPN11